MERYRYLWRCMGKNLLIKIKHDQTKVMETYGELRWAKERYGLKILITLLFAPSRALESYGELQRATASLGQKSSYYIQTWPDKSFGELRRATESYGSYREQRFYILITFVLDHSLNMKSYGELRRAMKSYGESFVENFLLHSNMNRQELRIAMESYRKKWQLRRALVWKFS